MVRVRGKEFRPLFMCQYRIYINSFSSFTYTTDPNVELLKISTTFSSLFLLFVVVVSLMSVHGFSLNC